MPSPRRDAIGATSRRRLLASLGTALAGGVAGCSDHVPGVGPASVSATTAIEDGRIRWDYPPREDGEDGAGYASISAERVRDREGGRSQLRLTFNSTVGDSVASVPYRGYQQEWFRFRIRPPNAFDRHFGYRVLVEPPGQWEEFETRYDTEGGVRVFELSLEAIGTDGTISVPALFEGGEEGLPDRLHCSFTVQASRDGRFGKTLRASGRGTLELGEK